MHFAKAHTIKKPVQFSVTAASVYVALFFVIAAALQLFAFETFPSIIESYGFFGGEGYGLPLAALIVCFEVLAIPYLLWMKLSPLMRWVSCASGWLVLTYWLFVGIWQSSVDIHISNAGLFGEKVLLPQGWWLVSYCTILLVLLAYVTWNSKLAPRSKN